MILSASYKTDIPAFYGDWFMKQLEAGYFKNKTDEVGINVRKGFLDGIIFWTKNMDPFFPHLVGIRAMEIPFIVQYTVNGYSKIFEPNIPDEENGIQNIKDLSKVFGPSAVIWRYDPIILSEITNYDYHLEKFRSIAERLAGCVNRVVISFVQPYPKTISNLKRMSNQYHFGMINYPDDTKRALASDLVRIAAYYGIQVAICAQKNFVVEGAMPSACADAARLSLIAGKDIVESKGTNRKDCGCVKTVFFGIFKVISFTLAIYINY